MLNNVRLPLRAVENRPEGHRSCGMDSCSCGHHSSAGGWGLLRHDRQVGLYYVEYDQYVECIEYDHFYEHGKLEHNVLRDRSPQIDND